MTKAEQIIEKARNAAFIKIDGDMFRMDGVEEDLDDIRDSLIHYHNEDDGEEYSSCLYELLESNLEFFELTSIGKFDKELPTE